MATRKKSPDAVTQQYAKDQSSTAMVYSKYKGEGYTLKTPATKAGAILVPESVSPSEAFELGGLDWEVEKRPGAYMGAAGPEPTDKYCSIVRTDNDKLLGIHRPSWTPTQNSEILYLFDFLRENVTIENILQIRNGEKVYITASLDLESEVVPGARIKKNLHVFNSFDGSTGYGAFFTEENLRCANQLHYFCTKAMKNAENAGEGMRHRHTASVTEFARKLPRLIDIEHGKFRKEIEEYQAFTTVQVDPAMFRQVLERTYADKLEKEIRDKSSEDKTAKRPRVLTDLKEFDPINSHFYGNTGIGFDLSGYKNTLWGLFNAVTQYETHESGRVSSNIEAARSRMERLYGGSTAQRINKAREVCLSLV
jgi:hypothetical protein